MKVRRYPSFLISFLVALILEGLASPYGFTQIDPISEIEKPLGTIRTRTGELVITAWDESQEALQFTPKSVNRLEPPKLNPVAQVVKGLKNLVDTEPKLPEQDPPIKHSPVTDKIEAMAKGFCLELIRVLSSGSVTDMSRRFRDMVEAPSPFSLKQVNDLLLEKGGGKPVQYAVYFYQAKVDDANLAIKRSGLIGLEFVQHPEAALIERWRKLTSPFGTANLEVVEVELKALRLESERLYGKYEGDLIFVRGVSYDEISYRDESLRRKLKKSLGKKTFQAVPRFFAHPAIDDLKDELMPAQDLPHVKDKKYKTYRVLKSTRKVLLPALILAAGVVRGFMSVEGGEVTSEETEKKVSKSLSDRLNENQIETKATLATGVLQGGIEYQFAARSAWWNRVWSGSKRHITGFAVNFAIAISLKAAYMATTHLLGGQAPDLNIAQFTLESFRNALVYSLTAYSAQLFLAHRYRMARINEVERFNAESTVTLIGNFFRLLSSVGKSQVLADEVSTVNLKQIFYPWEWSFWDQITLGLGQIVVLGAFYAWKGWAGYFLESSYQEMTRYLAARRDNTEHHWREKPIWRWLCGKVLAGTFSGRWLGAGGNLSLKPGESVPSIPITNPMITNSTITNSP